MAPKGTKCKMFWTNVFRHKIYPQKLQFFNILVNKASKKDFQTLFFSKQHLNCFLFTHFEENLYIFQDILMFYLLLLNKM